jgi:hypothetical protein
LKKYGLLSTAELRNFLLMQVREPSPLPENAWSTDLGPFAVKGVPSMGIEERYPRVDNFSYSEI